MSETTVSLVRTHSIKRGRILVGIGFIVTIVLLAVVLGLFSKQALSSEQEKSHADSPVRQPVAETVLEASPTEVHADATTAEHPHAM